MIESAHYASPTSVSPPEELLLPLPKGGLAQTIYISILPGGLTPTVGFALTQAGPFLSGGLTWAASTLETRHGTVSVRWELTDDDGLDVDVVLPPGVTGVLALPDGTERELD